MQLGGRFFLYGDKTIVSFCGGQGRSEVGIKQFSKYLIRS